LWAVTRYVSLDGGNIAPYTSWADAARTIQDAINVADDGDVILVASGVYNASGAVVDGVSNRVALLKPVTVQAVSGPGATVICGVPYDFSANVALRCAWLTNGAELHGFTLSNGSGLSAATDLPARHGAGVLMNGGGLLSNCIITANNGFSQLRGGGVYCHMGGAVYDSLVVSNNAFTGGGAYCFSAGSLVRCALTDNRAAGGSGCEGGGVCMSGGGLHDCIVAGNYAQGSGGGVFVYSYAALSGCLIASNVTADTLGGGGGVHLYLNGLVSNCTLTANRAHFGGGIYSRRRSAFVDCSVSGNHATRGGGFYSPDGGTLRGCRVAGNTAMNGAGVYAEAAAVTVALCRITGNTATNNGGGVYCASGASLFSCLIAYNSASNTAGACTSRAARHATAPLPATTRQTAVACMPSTARSSTRYFITTLAAANENWSLGSGVLMILYSSTAPLGGLPDGTGCIGADPLFAETTDFRLLDGSPCIDAGTNLPWMAAAHDLDGNPRMHNGRADMGCYEVIPEPGGMALLAALAVFLLREPTDRPDRSDPSDTTRANSMRGD